MIATEAILGKLRDLFSFASATFSKLKKARDSLARRFRHVRVHLVEDDAEHRTLSIHCAMLVRYYFRQLETNLGGQLNDLAREKRIP